MVAINNNHSKPKDFHRLYYLIKQIPEYQESRDGAGSKRSNADILIQGWIWQSTNEEKHKKSELTLLEYNRICSEIEKKYNLKPAVHRNKSVKLPGADKNNEARGRVLAAVHANLQLRGYDDNVEYNNDRNAYAIGVLMRMTGHKYKNYNDVPLYKLQNLYNTLCSENRMLRKQCDDGSNRR